MNDTTFYAIIIIGIFMIATLAYTTNLRDIELSEFCKNRGLEYGGYFDDSYHCMKVINDEIIQTTKIRCEIDILSAFTFRNPIKKCLIWETEGDCHD